MWKVALFVMTVTFLVLMLLLRSIVLPLKAVVMNLLSVSAAYGVLMLVFGTVETLIPPLVLAVVFGLSMDYEVFLLSRIRERYAATGDTATAVAEGSVLERLHDHKRGIDHGVRVLGVRAHGRALDQTARPGLRARDRDRRDDRAPGAGARRDGAVRQVELVAAARAGRLLPDTSIESLGQHAVAAVKALSAAQP